MATDPRFDGVQDLKAVQEQPGWYVFEHVAKIKGQGSATRYVSGENGDVLQEHYSRFLGTGYHIGMLINTELGTDTPSDHAANTYVSGIKVQVEAQGDVASGGGVYGVEVEATLGASCTINGQVSVVSAYFQADAATRTLNRTYQAIELGTYIGAGNTFASNMGAFIRCMDAGTVPFTRFLDVSGMSTSGALEVDSGAVGTIYGYLKCRGPAGLLYLVLYSSHS